MTTKIAINGFGRIGRLVLAAMTEQSLVGKGFDVVAVVEFSTDANYFAYQLKYDSVHGRFKKLLSTEKSSSFAEKDDILILDGHGIQCVAATKTPDLLPWKDLGVDYVIESTGLFTDADKAGLHLLEKRGHAVIVAAEGAGQDLLEKTGERDVSGNIRFQDVGIFLRDRIQPYFKQTGMQINLKYIDPSYTIRSIPADAYDSAFCLLLGQNAVHAGMAGRTNVVVGFWGNEFTHVPIPLAVSQRKKVDPEGWVWNSVISITGQPKEMR